MHDTQVGKASAVLRRGVIAVAISLLGGFGWLGCGNQRGPGSIREFPFTIGLLAPLGDAGSPLPEDIAAMLRPIAPPRCSSLLFLPHPRVVRLDLPGQPSEEIILPQARNRVQIAVGKPADPLKERAAREHAIVQQKITPLMARAAGTPPASLEGMRKMIGLAVDQRFYAFSGAMHSLAGQLNTERIHSVRDMGELTARISDVICSQTEISAQAEPSAIVMIYDPNAELLGSESGPPVMHENHERGASHDSESHHVEPAAGLLAQADMLLAELAQEVVDAMEGRANKRAVHARLAKAQADMTWDFRFTYERAKLAVYGTARHDEAFQHLARAAEIAIENGDAGKMLARLMDDGEEGGPFHRLAHDHGEWVTIRTALETGAVEAVRRLS